MRFLLRWSSILHFGEWNRLISRAAEHLLIKLQYACTPVHQNDRPQRKPHPSQHPIRFKCSGRSIASRGCSFINSSATRSQSFACNTNIARHVSVGCSAYYTLVSTPKSTSPPTECSDVYPSPTHVRILFTCLQAADVIPFSLSAPASLVLERVHAVVVALGFVRRFSYAGGGFSVLDLPV